MSGTLRAMIGTRAAAVIGRQAERAVLLELVDRDRPLVVTGRQACRRCAGPATASPPRPDAAGLTGRRDRR